MCRSTWRSRSSHSESNPLAEWPITDTHRKKKNFAVDLWNGYQTQQNTTVSGQTMEIWRYLDHVWHAQQKQQWPRHQKRRDLRLGNEILSVIWKSQRSRCLRWNTKIYVRIPWHRRSYWLLFTALQHTTQAAVTWSRMNTQILQGWRTMNTQHQEQARTWYLRTVRQRRIRTNGRQFKTST